MSYNVHSTQTAMKLSTIFSIIYIVYMSLLLCLQIIVRKQIKATRHGITITHHSRW